jgi:hypothetical protein
LPTGQLDKDLTTLRFTVIREMKIKTRNFYTLIFMIKIPNTGDATLAKISSNRNSLLVRKKNSSSTVGDTLVVSYHAKDF